MPTFIRASKAFNKRYASFAKDLAGLVHELEKNPYMGIDLGSGLRKVRMSISSKGRGKSGGARVITFTMVTRVTETEIGLVFICDKSERSSISKNEINALLRQCGLK